MLPPKIKLTDKILYNIKAARTEKRIPAATLSRAINRDDSYISSLELKRIRTISSVDLVAILGAIYDIPEAEAEAKAEGFAEGFSETVARGDNTPELDTHATLPPDGFEGAMMVCEPTAANNYYSTKNDYPDLELISDILDILKDHVTEFYKRDPKEAVFALNTFIRTMQFDPAFAMGVMGLPFSILKSLSIDKRMKVLSDFATILKEHA